MQGITYIDNGIKEWRSQKLAERSFRKEVRGTEEGGSFTEAKSQELPAEAATIMITSGKS